MSARDRLSDYLLGELPDDERARFERELAGDPELAAEAERLRPVVARLESLDPAAWDPPAAPPLPPLAPPATVPAPGTPPATDTPAAGPPRARSRRRRALVLRPFPAAALAAVLLALGVGTGLLLGGGDDDGAGGGRQLALQPVEPLGGSASGTATLASDGSRATVRVTGLPPSARGEFYELWLLNSPDDLVSLGSFRVPASGEADVTIPLPGDPADFAALDLSIEPPDGDPGHSSRSVLRAPLSESYSPSSSSST